MILIISLSWIHLITRNLQRIFQNDKNKKIFKLLDFTDNSKDIADPWYTSNFDLTYKEIEKGTKALLNL